MEDKSLIVSFSTDDGQHFIDRHSGDANFFDIYEISPNGYKFLKRVENTVEEEEHEEGHGDPKKAHGISSILKKEGVNVLVAKVFGPNITRVRQKFVCILMNNSSIEEAIKQIQENFDTIIEEWKKGENRRHLNYKNLN